MRRGEASRGSIPPRYVSPRRLSLTILLDVFLVSSLAAQSALNALPGSTRSAGLGGAGAALVGDAGALFANPAAIATVRRLAFEGSYEQYLGGTTFGAGAMALPRRTRAGFTMNYVDPQGTYRLLTTVEGQWPDTGSAFIVVGLEAGVVTHGVGLVGRTGYVGHSVATTASPFTFGGTVELGRLHLDYAYRGFDAPAGDTHRLGLRWTP